MTERAMNEIDQFLTDRWQAARGTKES